MKILFIVAHVDDAELAAGASISKFVSQGHDVSVISMTHIYNGINLAHEFEASMSLLGVSYRFCSFTTRQLSSQSSVIGDFLLEVMKNKPNMIFTHDEKDRHPDHRTVAEQVRRIWSGTLITFLSPWNGSAETNYFIQFDEPHLRMKKAALRKYTSQASRSYMDEVFIESETRYNGIRAGATYAEGFRVVKMVHGL